ncbi:MAG: hypothetical protein KatS3mg013_0319 [Actinomycetota bacterium]|nr:MAG: hypothetical protein KatS3mg013_0319 [Actinomycetota bacterium]
MRNARALWASVVFVAVLTAGATAGLATERLRPLLGLDLQGGVAVILSAPGGTPPDVMERTLETIRNRVDAFGVAEPDIFLAGTTIEVQIPGSSQSTVERRAAQEVCLVGRDAEGALVSYGCAPDAATAEQALTALRIRPQPDEVCLEAEGRRLQCYGSRAEARFAQAGLSVAATSSPTPSAVASPGPTAGPAPLGGSACIVDPLGTELACFGSRSAAEQALEAVEAVVTRRSWCVVDAGARAASPTPTATPTSSPDASPSPAPAGLALLDRTGAVDLPCGLASEQEATRALGQIQARPVTERFCVVSGAGEDLGCFLDRLSAERRQRETGQQRLIEVIGETARLEERPVLEIVGRGDPRWAGLAVTCPTPEEQREPRCSFEALADQEVVYLAEDQTKYRLGPVTISGADFREATATLQPSGSTGVVTEWVVRFVLDGDGARRFADATTRAVAEPAPRNQIAIVVDRVVISAPVVNEPITQGEGVITGGFTEQEAKDLATQLNAGALPVELTRQSVRTVSPTLGEESLRQAVAAGLGGLALLFVYLLLYYRMLGVVASLGMAIWAALAVALVALAGSSVGYALSLAGVAGLLISLGVTADSYIVFFERLKDEIRAGRSPRAAVQPAFKRAFRTLIAADIVTLIAAGVLYLTAVSSVRGFALTLGVATLLDVFVIWFYKRPVVFLLARSRRIVELPGIGLLSSVAAERPGRRSEVS